MTIRQQIEEERRRQREESDSRSLSETLNDTADAEASDVSLSDLVGIVPTAGANLIRGSVALPLGVARFIGNTMFDPDAAEKQAYDAADTVAAVAHDMWENPTHALPMAGMLAGGALGGMVGLPNVGAGAGAFVGTALQNELEGTPWTKEDVGDVMIAPLANVPYALGGALLRKATGTARLTTKGSAVYQADVLSPENIALADSLIDESRATAIAKREIVHGNKPREVLGKAHSVAVDVETGEQLPLFVDTPPPQMKQRALFPLNAVGKPVSGKTARAAETAAADLPDPRQLDLFNPNGFEQLTMLDPQERLSQLSLFRPERYGARQPVLREPPTVALPDAPNANQLELFRPDVFDQPDLFPRPDQFRQQALFAARGTHYAAEAAAAERALPPAASATRQEQMEMFRPSSLEQLEMFLEPERFRQPSLFVNKGLHHTAGGEEAVLGKQTPPTPREVGNRYAQPTMLPHKDKYKQLDLFPARTRPRTTQEPVVTVPDPEQLDLPLSRRLRPAPLMKEGATEPTALFQLHGDAYDQPLLPLSRRLRDAPDMKAGADTPTALYRLTHDQYEQPELALPRRPGEAPVIDPGGEWRPTDLRAVRTSRVGKQYRLDMPDKRSVPDINEGPEWLGTHLTPVQKAARMKQAELFPPAPAKADAHVRQYRFAQRVANARAKLDAHVAEVETQLAVNRSVKSDPGLAAVWEDERHAARLSVLDPEHLQPHVNPVVKELQKAGMTASFANPHYALEHELGSHGHWLSQNIMEAKELHSTATTLFKQRTHALMDEYSIGEHDLASHGFLHVLYEHPELRDAMRTGGVAAIPQWEKANNVVLNVKPKDYGRLQKIGEFADRLKADVHDPMWAFAMQRNADPKVLGQYDVRYMLPTYTARRALADLEGDIASVTHAYSSLSEADRAGEHGRMLRDQGNALKRKLAIVSKAAQKSDERRGQASQTLYKRGMRPGEIFSSAFKDAHSGLMFGTGLRSSMDDHIDGFIKKAIYDPVNKRISTIINTAPWQPSTKRWATALALDQAGTRRQVQMTRLNDKLKEIPLLGKHVTDDTAERAINGVSQWNAAVNIGLNARFYPINSTQILTMGYGLVGMDGLAHGLAKVVSDWPAAYAEAVAAGSTQSGMQHLWKEGNTTARGTKITRFTNEALSHAGKLAESSEILNRTLMHHAGLFVAGKKNLTGREAQRYARDISRMANHGYSAAERPTVSGTLAGSMLTRYKSFGMQYVSYVRHLAKTDPKAAAETLAMVMALGGTAGIPMFGMVQDQLAKHGYDFPNITPFDEVTGLGLAESFNPWPDIPAVTSEFTIENLAGPLLGPPAAGLAGAYEQDQSKLSRAVTGMLGAGIARPLRAFDEYMRGGLTTTASGNPLIRRKTPAIVKGALGVGPTPRGEAYQHSQDVKHALKLGDTGKIMDALRRAQIAGVSRPTEMLSGARRIETTNKRRKSVLDELWGR